MWPVKIVTFASSWGGIGLGLAFTVFSMFLQDPIERWLEDGDSDPNQGDSKGDSDPN